jgi:hypothetical protein
VRFRRNAFSPLTPAAAIDDVDWSRKSHIGLGIQDAQFRPDSTPITPGTAERGGERASTVGRKPSASNIAERIEQKLWKYSASGNVIKRWLIEIVSWSLAALCMTGIVVMLIIYRNDRIPNWPMGLTLNAYISVLSKVASAALLLPVSEALGQLKWSWFQGKKSQKMWDFEIFDNASRGPWGSFLLLVRTKGKSLAALGAGVTLFALALDPFFQQVVEYPEHWRLQEGTGSIPRATTYKPYIAGKEYREGLEMLQTDQTMMGVAHRFFYDNGTAPVTFGRGVRAELPLACPNSNCTWPEYETFGVCNRCTEVSDLLEFKCVHGTLDWIQVPGVNETTDEATYPNGTACGYFLKADGDLLMTGYDVDKDTPHAGEVLLMRSEPLWDVTTRAPLAGYPKKLQNRNPLAHVVIVSGKDHEYIKQNGTPIAHECVLSWCAKQMISSYTEGGYNEEVLGSINNDTDGPSPWLTYPTFNDVAELTGWYYSYNESVIITGRDGFNYSIDNETHNLALTMFDDIFPATYTLANSTDLKDAMLRYKQYRLIGPFTRNITYNPYMYENITQHMTNLATALTNYVRSSGASTEMIQGPSFDLESFVSVRWGWMALPIGLLAATFVFLSATVIRSSIEQDTVGVWKTSAIATLLYGLPDEMQKQITASKENGTPRAKTKELRVKWMPKAGWRLSGSVDLSDSKESGSPESGSPESQFKESQFKEAKDANLPPPGWI